MVAGSTGSEKVNVQGLTVLKPSSALRATCGPPKSVGSETGMLRVRSPLPDNSRLIGNGKTPLEGSKFAVITSVVGVPSGLSVGGAGTERGVLELPPQPARMLTTSASAGIRRYFIRFSPRSLSSSVIFRFGHIRLATYGLRTARL